MHSMTTPEARRATWSMPRTTSVEESRGQQQLRRSRKMGPSGQLRGRGRAICMRYAGSSARCLNDASRFADSTLGHPRHRCHRCRRAALCGPRRLGRRGSGSRQSARSPIPFFHICAVLRYAHSRLRSTGGCSLTNHRGASGAAAATSVMAAVILECVRSGRKHARMGAWKA